MTYRLKLFVAGDSDLSRRAISNLERICADRLLGNCDTEIVDILQSPDQARAFRVLATPVTIRVDVSPPLKALGDLSNEQRLLQALNLTVHSQATP